MDHDDDLADGLYEQLISDNLKNRLDNASDKQIGKSKVDTEESARIYADYLAALIKQGMSEIKQDKEQKLALANGIISLISKATKDGNYLDATIDKDNEQLLSVTSAVNKFHGNGNLQRPVSPLSCSSIFTGAKDEPLLASELKKEILSSDEIYMLVSFIKWSGLVMLFDELKQFTRRGGILKVITTSYMGATDVKAIRELSRLAGTSIRVSYDTKVTRLHAKSYIFIRKSGFTTAYIGSSNLSNPAITSGKEWNIKITATDQPEVLEKVLATFDSYWEDDEFEPYLQEDEEKLRKALKAEHSFSMAQEGLQQIFDIRPYHYQKEVLDRIQFERLSRHNYRNLIVAATGTGKTVIAAFDYRRFCEQKENRGKANTLLFVAHREEILKQSIATFRGILRDANFGSLYTGHHHPDEDFNHLFITIQSLHGRSFPLNSIPGNFYDYIVIDESHHSRATSYRPLFSHFTPKILLGLTATPERMDGKSILTDFNGRITAELGLSEAIDRSLLCPFQYFGVTDNVNLENVRWTRHGYDENELEQCYLTAKGRVGLIIRSIDTYCTDPMQIIALGFCVTVKHAQFMAAQFNEYGIPSASLDGNSNWEIRKNIKKQLTTGKIRFLFVVDLYNEGVDIPQINTVLFLRPTASKTVFLQQLGRGLRLYDGKDRLLVLDFIGQANRKYRFEEKLSALLPRHAENVRHEIEAGFPSVPKGCFIQLEEKAQAYILENLKASGSKNQIRERIKEFTKDLGNPLSLKGFLEYYQMDPREIYKGKTAFSRLAVEAGCIDGFHEPLEKTICTSLATFCYCDSLLFMDFISTILQKGIPNHLNLRERRMLNMFQYTLWTDLTAPKEDMEIQKAIDDNPILFNELSELLSFRRDYTDLEDDFDNLSFGCPLSVHATYSRNQLFTALGLEKPGTAREGVRYLPAEKTDVLLITLNKTEKDYSPTTMYNDYLYGTDNLHWQSQSTTSETSVTGERYINHEKMHTSVLIFVRKTKRDSFGGTMPYTFMGKARYVTHHGSKPMNITWKLESPIPAKYRMEYQRLINA